MASAAVDEVDYFELSASAARRLKTSPASLIRFECVRLQLAARGVRKDDSRIPLWVAPILCKTPEARRQFLDNFPEQATDLEQGSGAAKPTELGGRAARRRLQLRRPGEWRRSQIAAAAVLIFGIAAVLLAKLLWPEPGPLANVTDAILPPDPIDAKTGPAAPADAFNPLLLLWLVLPALLATLYILWLRRRRRIIRRDHAPQPERSVRLAFETGFENFLAERSLRRALGNLRRHRPVISSKLNVPAAIRATIRSAGFPQMRYGFRPRSPEYLLLNERESPADHLSVIGQVLATRMTEEHVAHSQYEYFGDPRRLQRIERGAPTGVFPLTTVLARHDGARVMLLQESHDSFSEEKSPEWLARLAETERPVLLNPRSPDGWGSSEYRLTSLGFGIFPPNGQGIGDYGDYLNTTGNVRRRLARGNTSRFDLPESLAGDRDLLLSSEKPLEPLIAELITDLDLWLDEAGGYWLRALALFPYIDPGLTVFLGTALSDPDGRPLMQEGRFFDLARLPWLRAGRMPDWMRIALVHGLTPDQLEAATDAIQAFLMPTERPDGTTQIEFSRGRDRQLRKRLLDWLKLTPESLLSDQLLIEALGGRPPDQLGVEVPTTLLRHSQSLWANNEVRAIVVALAATVAIAAWQWQSRPSEVKTDTTAVTPASDGPVQPRPPTPEEEAERVAEELEAAADAATNAAIQADPESTTATNDKEENGASEGSGSPLPGTEERKEPPVSVKPPEQVEGQRVLHSATIFFDWNNSQLTPQAQDSVQRVADRWSELINSDQRYLTIIVDGHTDLERSPSYSMALSERMANSVRDLLSKLDIPSQDIRVRAFGSTRPRIPTRQGVREPQNRRVEIFIVAQPPPMAS